MNEELLFSEEELNKLYRERAGLSSDIASDVQDIVNIAEKNVKNLKFEDLQRRNILKLLREFNRISQRNLGLSFEDLSNAKQRKKVQDDINRINQITSSLSSQALKLDIKDVEVKKAIQDAIADTSAISKDLVDDLSRVRDVTAEIGANTEIKRFKGISDFFKSIPGLKNFAQPFEDTANKLIKIGVKAKENQTIFEESLNSNKAFTNDLVKELGIEEELGKLRGGSATQFLKKRPELQEKILKKLSAQVQVEKESAKTLADQFKLFGGGAIATRFFTKLISDYRELDSLQAEYNRELGRSVDTLGQLNSRYTTSIGFIKTALSLTQQFGFASDAAFSSDNLSGATDLVSLMKLTADQAGRFALFSQTTGTSIDDNLDAIVAQVGEINVANKSAVTQKRIIEDISNTSSAIALTFQGNTVQLAKAAQNARILGINLQQADSIAQGLLDVESSLAAEFEAEVVSGKQLNLERARFFALTNDLNGLILELKNNEEAINEFATGNRIEQEAIASALGMSRDEMADMIFQQRVQLGITDEQARLTKGLSKEDFQRLSAQESLAKSLEKMTSQIVNTLNPAMKFFADNAYIVSGLMAGIAAISLFKLLKELRQMGKLLAVMTGLNVKNLPFALVGMATAAAAFKQLTEAGDAIIPSSGRPIISTREGGLIQGTANDDVIMAPGIARGGRNTGLSQADIAAIAKAVRDGASQAQINLDGDRVSNRLQPSLAVNTRRYSI